MSGSEEVIDPLAHLPLVYAIARRKTSRGDSFDYEDAVQIGCVGLMQAIASYDPSKGPFGTHAYYRIFGALQDELRRLDSIPRKGIERGFERTTLYSLEQLTRAHDGSPDDERFDIIAPGDDFAELDERYAAAELRRRLTTAVKRLSPRQQRVLKLRYRYGRRFVDIARDFGVTEGRACQLHKAAIKRLRKLLGM